jgi:tRNA(fMet)-specific endonuclease VapC
VARRLILDTGVLIAVERGHVALDDVVSDDDDLSIAAVTAAELLVGVELAGPAHRSARREFVDTLLSTVPALDYTLDVARAHAALLAHVRRTGRPRGAHDLLIAATAVATDRTVVTADAQEFFGDLPGLRVLVVSGRP